MNKTDVLQRIRDTGLIPVPTLANRTGNLADRADELTGEVGGPYLANLLSQKLGYGVLNQTALLFRIGGTHGEPRAIDVTLVE